MSRGDWFRRTSWTLEDETEFFARLSRSRSAFHKAQYVRIQAITLSDVGGETLLQSALMLLDRLFQDWPEASELESAHLQAATCNAALNRLDDAIEHFQSSIRAHQNYPNSSSGVNIEYPWFVAERQLAEYYDEAMEVLESADAVFPIQRFKVATIKTRIMAHRGQLALAAGYAREAIEAAGLRKSGFWKHQSLGLVGNEHANVLAYLRKLAAT